MGKVVIPTPLVAIRIFSLKEIFVDYDEAWKAAVAAAGSHIHTTDIEEVGKYYSDEGT